MADTCRCHLPLDPPFGPHWLPVRDLEPGPQVLAVALHGQSPTFLRRVRVFGGWHSEGLAAAHPEVTPPTPWVEVGRCWADEQHAVVDVTEPIEPGAD